MNQQRKARLLASLIYWSDVLKESDDTATQDLARKAIDHMLDELQSQQQGAV
jgi:hypothetical protein